jgi:hypothetical protein
MRLRVEYFDQNEEFAPYLPRVGVVSRVFKDSSGVGEWLLLDLEEPLEYQLKVGEPFQFRLARVDAFLIRSRWQDKEVGDSDGTSVFILLVEEGRHPVNGEINPESYVRIAWGMCGLVPAG